MAAKNIELKTLIFTIGLVVAVEVGLKWVLEPDIFHPIAFLGVVRLLEIVLLLLLVHFSESKGLKSIGIRKNRLADGLKTGGIWSAVFGILAALSFAGLYVLTGISPSELVRSGVPSSIGAIFLFYLVGGIVSPVAEEIVFRGILYGFLRRWGFLAALLVSTLLFVLAHTTGRQIPIPQIVGGFVFALAYEREKNLVVPVVIHILGNLAIFTLSII